jgi:NTP pyrophosphatase (non-canonical NTP hydrolase)
MIAGDSEDQKLEALGILQEECAEVIVEVSKVRRFGLDNSYNGDLTQRDKLENELGDVLAMIDILIEQGIVTQFGLAISITNKKEKLKQWSKIYETESK